MLEFFKGSYIVTVLGLLVVALFGWQEAAMAGALAAVISAAILAVLEVSLSFDNAVVNAKVLGGMDPKWQQAFLTWGMIIAVFGMRLVFPIVIVCVTAGLGPWAVTQMALTNPTEYAKHLLEAHAAISAFGGTFLAMVFFGWAFDPDKDSHWLGPVETLMSKAGKIDMLTGFLGMTLAFTIGYFAPVHEQATVLLAGLAGVMLNVGIDIMTGLFEEPEVGDTLVKGGVMSFIYLEILDASFSFDGVIGAFAVTNNVLVIMVGLAIGAMFVRSLTIMLVKKGTLAEYRYLEHGAHWGIGALAAAMLVSLWLPVPEVVTGLIGVAFIGTAFWSSLKPDNSEVHP